MRNDDTITLGRIAKGRHDAAQAVRGPEKRSQERDVRVTASGVISSPSLPPSTKDYIWVVFALEPTSPSEARGSNEDIFARWFSREARETLLTLRRLLVGGFRSEGRQRSSLLFPQRCYLEAIQVLLGIGGFPRGLPSLLPSSCKRRCSGGRDITLFSSTGVQSSTFCLACGARRSCTSYAWLSTFRRNQAAVCVIGRRTRKGSSAAISAAWVES